MRQSREQAPRPTLRPATPSALLALVTFACLLGLSGQSQVAASKQIPPGLSAPRDVAEQPATNLTIRGHVILPGRPSPPDVRWVTVVTGTLALASDPASVCLQFTTLTDASGYFTITEELAPGDYLWNLKAGQSLANSGVAGLTGALNLVEMGTLRMGDANNDNCTGAIDFSLLKRSFGKAVGQQGFDDRADFNGDGVVNVSDFSLLLSTFGTCGASPICSAPPAPTPPPDPVTLAPPISIDLPTDLGSSTSFLYTGDNPIQTGVTPGTIEMTRAAVLRGHIYTREMQALSGVLVEVMNHQELGHTLSRADGGYDLAVNGGGPLVLEFSAGGYLPAQRKVTVPWQDFQDVEDVALVPLDPSVTTISTFSNDPMQVARGSVVSDADGVRQDTLMFSAGTTAIITLSTGIAQTLNTYNVRSTEYTLGDSGPEAMPGELPPTSGYTQASEFSVDEAMAVGAKEVGFSHPVVSYIENFLNFPVGVPVPVGYYDKSQAQWVAADNGLVLTVLTSTGGLADLDIHGQGIPATPAELAALGVTDPERAELALLYPSGQSVWRIMVTHFSSWDRNWGFGPPDDAEAPTGTPTPEPDEDKQDCQGGSVIGCQNQSLGEILRIAGVPFSLHYLSSRMPGYSASRTLSIPLSGPTLPGDPGPTAMQLEVSIAGHVTRRSFTPVPNFRTSFTWNGTDAYNRTVQGCMPIEVSTGFTYPGVTVSRDSPFGYNGNGTIITGNRQNRTVTLWSRWQDCMGGWQAPPQEIGGWGISIHHTYDQYNNILYMGDGTKRSAQGVGPVISLTSGTGTPGYGGDGGPATLARLRYPTDAVTAPDGSLYVADHQNHRIRKIDPGGVITTVAGTGLPGYTGDGGPATLARLFNPYALAIGPDGSLYIADTGNNRIRKVSTDGTISTVAGSGLYGYGGDGGPATLARLGSPSGVAVALDGSMYIADTDNNRVRQVGTDGNIITVAGTGTAGYSGDGGQGTNARLYHPVRVAITQDGALYISDLVNHRVRALRPDGVISTFAGTGTSGFSGDGGPANVAQLNGPIGLALDPAGTLYIADSGNNRVRHVDSNGIIVTLGGNGTAGYSGDEGLAANASLNGPSGVSIGPDGVAYIADTGNSRVREIGTAQPSLELGEFVVPSEDGTLAFVFDSGGRHQRTVDALTGALLYRFSYDTGGNLTDITDGDDNNTHIERDQDGNPPAIVGPYGQRTELLMGADGYLASVTNPASETTSFTYAPGGLLTLKVDARNNQHLYAYDSKGRLAYDQGPDGSYKLLSRVTEHNAYTVTVTTAMSRTTTYRVEDLAGGAQRRIKTDPSGARAETYKDGAGNLTITDPDGTITTRTLAPDPRWNMLAPIAASTILRTPGGLIHTTTGLNSVLLRANDPLAVQALTDTVTVNGRTSTSVYDASSSTMTDTTAMGRQSFTQLNSHARPVFQQTLGLGPATFSYDGRGRPIVSTFGNSPGLRTKSLAYDSQGFVGTVTDTLGTAFGFSYDAVGRVLDRLVPLGRTEHYTYDSNGNLTSVQPAGQPLHTLDYTASDLQSDYSPPPESGGASSTHYTYNLDRQLTEIVQPGGVTITFGYDSAGRPSSLTHPLGGTSASYDPVTGNLIQLGSSDGVTQTYGYDGSILTDKSWTGLVSGALHFTFSNDFRLSSESINGANTVNYAYDLDCLVTQAGALSASRSPQNGLLTGTSLGAVSETLAYNQFGEVLTHSAAYNGTTLLLHSDTRDNAGRISQRVEALSGITHTVVYTYDVTQRLTDVARDGLLVAHYDYSPNGNRTAYAGPGGTVAGTYDTQDRLLQYGNYTFTYTPNGELQSRTDTSTGQATTYSYDALGNLRSVTLPGGTQVSYVIDGNDRRVGKKVNGTLLQGFLYRNALEPAAELDGAGNVVSRFVYGTQAHTPNYMVRGGQTYFIVADQLGSPRLVIDTASGQIAQRIDYDEYGNVLTDTNPGFQPFGFAGGLYDRDTGLVRFGARDYDPTTGRWTAKDPSLFGGGSANLYGYVGGDPVNLLDPSGLDGTGSTDSGFSLIDFGLSLYDSYIDLWAGHLTGDTYMTPMAAATAALNYINPLSIEECTEFAGCIFRNSDGTYSWTWPERGIMAGSSIIKCVNTNIDDIENMVGYYHTHGSADPDYDNEHFSPPDIKLAADFGIDAYLGTPAGSLVFWNYKVRGDPYTYNNYIETKLPPPSPWHWR